MRRPDMHAVGGRVMRLPGARLTVRILADIARGNVTDRSMTLAAQAFTSILPIVILLLSLPGTQFVENALTELGVPVYRLDHTRVGGIGVGGIGIEDTPQTVATFGVLGALMTIAGATSLSRALGRMYVSIWDVTKLPLRAFWRWIVVLFLIPAAVVVQGLCTGLQATSLFGVHLGDRGLLGIALMLAATVTVWSVTFTAIPRLLVSSQVPVRLLALNGLVTGIAVTALLTGSRIALPALASATIGNFGTLGVVFVTITWLFVFAAILVITAIIMHAVVTDDGRVGRRVQRWAGTPTPFEARTATPWYGPRGIEVAPASEPKATATVISRDA